MTGCRICDSGDKCSSGVCEERYIYDSVSETCLKCNDKCNECGPDINTCITCLDSTRDSSRDCECNFGFYADNS